jgi:hypothetical protein
MLSSFLPRALVLPILLATAACTGPSLFVPMPQSNFTLPNSNLVPMGHVKGTVNATYVYPIQSPVIPDARMQREAYAKALQGSGGDLIIDGDYVVRTTLISLIFLQVYTVEGTVEGTAVKVAEIGERPLR